MSKIQIKREKLIYLLILWRDFYKRLTSGNQHSENNNEQKATFEQQTNENKMLKLYHARGVFQSSVSWITMKGASESCTDVWVNRVRLASDRASTDCWQRPCPVSSCRVAWTPRKNPSNTRAPSPPTPRPLWGWAHISPSKRQMAK